MLPMSIRCKTCGTYIYRGTKFSARKENAIGETYLGIQIFRFYFKCSNCSAEVTVKTDPQNSDYVVELGATWNFEPLRAEDEKLDNERRKREAEEMGNSTKSLENRVLDYKREMDVLDALDELKSMKSRHATVSANVMLEALQCSSREKEKLEEEDEAIIKSIVFNHSKDFIRRIDDDDDGDDGEDEDKIHPSRRAGELKSDGSKRIKVSGGFSRNSTDSLTADRLSDGTSKSGGKFGFNPAGSSFDGVSVVRKPVSSSTRVGLTKTVNTKGGVLSEPAVKKDEGKAKEGGNAGVLSLCQNYGSDDDSE